MCDISVTSVHGSIGLNGHRWLRSVFFTWLEFFFIPHKPCIGGYTDSDRIYYLGKSNQKLKAHREKDGKGRQFLKLVVTILNEGLTSITLGRKY